MQTETEIQQALLRAEQHCKANGATLTAIRRTVLTLLYRARGGMKAYDLLDVSGLPAVQRCGGTG